MLSSLDNVVNAGIRFEANVREIDRAESYLGRLDRKLRETAAGAAIFSEGTNTANRSLNKQAGAAGGASTGLGGLQAQLAATAAAQKALKSSSGDLREALADLGSEGQDLTIDSVASDLLGNLDKLEGAPDDFSLDYYIDDIDDAEEFARIVTGLQDSGFGEGKLFGGDEERIEDIAGMKEQLDVFDSDDFGEEKFGSLFGDYSGEETIEDFPLDPRSDEFPEDLGERFDAHIFEQFNRNSDFDYFSELMEDDSVNPADLLEVGGFAEDHTRGIKNIDGDGRSLLESEEVMNNLGDEQGIKTLDDFFRASDDQLNDALKGTTLGDYGVDADELRQSALEGLKEGEIEGKDLSDISPLGKGVNDTSEYVNIAEGNEELRESRRTVRTPDSILNKLDKQVPGDDDAIHESSQNLAMIMSKNEEINRAIANSSDLREARNMVTELDPDGLVKVNRAINNNAEQMAQSITDTNKLGERLGSAKKPEEFDQMVSSRLDLDNDRQSEILQNMMGDLDPTQIEGSGEGSSLPMTRETLGLMTMQEMMDTDPDAESDRYSDLKGIMETIYDPNEGVQRSLLRNQSVMEDGFYTDLQDALPEHLTSPGGIGQNTDQPDIARDITDEFLTGKGTEGKGISDFIGKDSRNIGDVVSRSTNRFDFDDPNALDIASSETEKLLPMMLHDQFGSQLAPGMTQSGRRSDVNMNEMFPGMGVLGNNNEDGPNFGGWFKGLDKDMADLRKAQNNAPSLAGGAFSGIFEMFGGSGEKKGIFGALSESAAGSGFFDSPRKMNKFNNFLDEGAKHYKGMIPLLEATSLRLGSVNVDFESLGMMFFKLTSMLGPLIAALGGLAGAAAGAGAALGGVLAAGAFEFLDDMENTMAGVSNKQEAMKELAGTIKDMAIEAIMPLRQARIGGDGNTGAQAFVEVIRSGLQILNRISNILAYIVELEVVGDEVARLAGFLNDPSGDSELARQLGELVETVLPLLNDMIIALLGSFGGFSEFAADIAYNLGNRLLRVLQQIAPVMKLLTAYGAGFFDMALMAVGVLATLVGVIETVVSGFTGLVNIIPGVNVETTQLTYFIGGLVGIMNIASRAAAFMSATQLFLAKTLWGAATAASWATKANYGLAASLALVASLLATVIVGFKVLQRMHEIYENTDWGLNLESVFALGTLTAYMAGLIALAKVFLVMHGATIGILGIISKIGAGLVKVLGVLGIGAAKFAQIRGIVAVIVGLTKWLAKSGLVWVAKLLTGIGAVTVGWAIVIATVVALLGDLIYYLATGDSFLLDWAKHIQTLNSYLERTRDILSNISNNGRYNWEVSQSEIDERFGGGDSSHNSKQTSTPDNSNSFDPQGTTAQNMDLTINVDAALSGRELSRRIYNEIESWWSSATN